jgi:hypothetical protein
VLYSHGGKPDAHHQSGRRCVHWVSCASEALSTR